MSNVTESNADTLALLKEALKGSAFTNHLGAEPTSCGDGKATVELTVQEHMTQHLKYIHGAVIGFVADSACCWAAISELGNVVTAEYKINFIKPAFGQKLIGRGEVIGSTGKTAVTQCKVYAVNNGREKLVASAMATIAAV